MADGFLSDPCCAFHRNVEISSCYAWIHRRQPACFKWAAMAAIASHHIRLVLFPLRLDTDRTGFVDIPHSLGRRKLLLTEDVDTIRATNNAIFNDIFWVHLAYVTADDGIERLRALLQAERHYAPVLAGFEAIDQGRRVLADAMASAAARQAACDLIWQGNVELLRHEQRAVVQPNFDRLSCAFARLISIGSATSFEVRGVRREVASFTSFYLYSLSRGIPHALRAPAWPRITRFDDRWRWLVTSVVPRFRRIDADTCLVSASLRRISDEASHLASAPCVLPRAAVSHRRKPAALSQLTALLDQRRDPGLVGLGQLGQGVSDRPHGAVVEVRLVAEAERRVPRLELLRGLEMADDGAVLGVRRHAVPRSRRKVGRAGRDDGMDPLGHHAIRFLHLGDLLEHVTLSVRLARARRSASFP